MSTYRRKLTGTSWMHRPLVTEEELDEYFRDDDWSKERLEPESEPESESLESD